MKSKTLGICVLLLIVCTANLAFGKTFSKEEIAERCKEYDDASIRSMAGEIEAINQMLPTVPPEEAEYLSAETARRNRAVFQENDDATADKIQAQMERRKYYAVWDLKSDIDFVLYFLKDILAEPSDMEKADSIANALTSLYSYKEDAERYYEEGKIDAPRSALNKLHASALLMSGQISGYLKCKIAKAAPTK